MGKHKVIDHSAVTPITWNLTPEQKTERERKRAGYKTAAKAKIEDHRSGEEKKRLNLEAINATMAKLAPELAPVAERIRALEYDNVALSKRTVVNVLEIAKILGGVRPNIPHGGWGIWLRSEFKWSARTSARYWSVYELTKRVSDLDQLQISVSVLYLLAEVPKRLLKRQFSANVFAEIIALARKERVTKEVADAILEPLRRYPNGTSEELLSTYALDQKITPEEAERKAHAKRISREVAISNVVHNDLQHEFGRQAFKNALATMSKVQADKFLMVVLDVLDDYVERKRHPSRFDGCNIHDGDPDFDIPDQGRKYEATLIPALGEI